jgi:glycosyltransferase involved in cell wall biosynthesis
MPQPMVSVRVVTYNHEQYITRCIEGILMQKTNFPFEVIIGEDFSTDKTREIVCSYRNQYPDKIKVLLSAQNLGPAHNSLQVFRACQGRYHAMCEGDDYWIDPLKLQKQVDLLEANPGLSLCFHNVFAVNEKSAVTRLFYESPLKETLNFDDVCQISTPTASVMARSEILATLPEWRMKVWCSDAVFRLWCAHHGKLGYINEIMAVYRVHEHSLTASGATQREKYFSQEMFLYQQLDQDTGYQHHEAIRLHIKSVQERYAHARNPAAYYLMHPLKFIARFGEYRQIFKRFHSIRTSSAK